MNAATYEITITKSMHGGWKAESRAQIGECTDNFNRPAVRVLKLTTLKTSSGHITSTARVYIVGNGFETTVFGGDYQKTILERAARATQKTIRDQHAEALPTFHGELERVKKLYDCA